VREATACPRRSVIDGTPSRQHGIAALAVTVLLFFAMVLGVAYVNRNLVFEHRGATNQYRATQAFEAAEAGLEWALALLDDPRPIGADCLPIADPAATSFRERHLAYDAANASFVPTTWLDGTVATPLAAACVRGGAGWVCSCPSAAHPVLAEPAGVVPAPAFTVRFQALGKPSVVRAIATGCTRLAGACSNGAGTADATAHVEAVFALVPALRSNPAAPLTVRGDIDADAAAFGAHNAEPDAGGIVLHAGGAVRATNAVLSGPAGAAIDGAIVAADAGLASASAERFFAAHFGLDPDAWRRQPVARALQCTGLCTAALQGALDAVRGPTLLYVDGDLELQGPATFGSPTRPVALVVRGALRVRDAVAISGLVYGATVTWDATPTPGAQVRGAVLSEGDYRGDGTPSFTYDAAVLARLRAQAGSFVRLPGSWKDF
jgi:hypothetical protein